MKLITKQENTPNGHSAVSFTLNGTETTQNPTSNSFILTAQQPNTHIQSSSQHHSSETNKKSINQIYQLYNQIHSTINDMDNKVEHVIRKHQTQFLFAYRNHIKKIKKQLSQIKYKSEEQEKMFSSNDRIQYLQQELALFRQQTMKAYNKLDQKNDEIDFLKMKVKELEKQTEYANSELKEQVKRNMVSEMHKANLQERIMQLEAEVKKKDQEILKLTLRFKQSESNNVSTKLETTLGSKIFNNQHLRRSEKLRTSPKSKQTNSINSSINVSTSANFNAFQPPQSPRIFDSELKQWFLQCIKTVKREVASRNNSQRSLDLNNITTIDEFMMVDKLRLLQIFIQSEKLLGYMYEKIFPDRLTTLRQKLTSSRAILLPKSSSKNPAILTQREQRPPISLNEDLINDRYKTNKTSQLPKVLSRISEHKEMKINQRCDWKGTMVLKNGKLNISHQ